MLPKSLTTCTLGETAPLSSLTIGEEFLPYSKRTIFAYLQSKLSSAQCALEDNRSITIPQLQDALWIVTDGCVKNRGSAATLYVHQNGSLLLAGFFSAKLCKHQVTCLPCEIKALAVGTAIRHFAPYIMQSPHTSEVLTDSRPCVQAYEKLKRGEFSASSRVTTLSTVSCYSVHISHIAGVENLPPDYAS